MFKKIALLLLLAVLTYANSLKSPFMLDDFGFFGSNRSESLWSLFIPNHNAVLKLDSDKTDHTYYRPLAHVVPMACNRVFGNQVIGYHVVNLILLWLAAVTIFIFLTSSPYAVEEVAFWAAGLFIVHPLNGVLVNYITASVFSVQVICMMGSLICLLRAPNIPSQWTLYAIGFFILSLLCHETAVLLPIFAILVLRLRLSWREAFGRILPLLGLLVLYFLFRLYASPFSKSILYSRSILDLNFVEQAATVVKLLGWYASKLFVPQGIFLMWSTPFVKTAAWGWAFGGLAAAAVIGVLLRFSKDGALKTFAIWFLLGLSPILAGAFVTPYMGGLIEPHWFVFGMVGFCAMVAIGLSKIPQIMPRRIAVVCLCAILVCLSWRNNYLWSDEGRFYKAWTKEAPDFKAVHYFLGIYYERQGDNAKAYEHLQKSLLGRYKDWMVYLELGSIDLRSNRLTEAEANLSKAFDLEPKHSGVLNACGALLLKQGKLEKAKELLEKAVTANPSNLEPRMNIAAYYLKMKNPKQAVVTYQEIIAVDPHYVPALKKLNEIKKTIPDR